MTNGAIVVGAGPVGLALAGELRVGGVDVVVYDKLPAPTGESRAAGFTRRTAEIFDQRGLLPRFGDIAWGRQVHYGGVRLDLDILSEQHSGIAGLPQSRTEAGLQSWLDDLGVPVRRGYELVAFRETGDAVVAEFDGPAGRVEDTAGYLVGCDGGDSTVRRLAGIDFPGTPATRGSYMADIVGVEVRPRPMGERIAGGMVLSIPFGRSGVHRIVVHEPGLRPHPADVPLTFAEIADAWQRMTGESLHHAEPRWMCTLDNATGLATEYRRGRVFLAGDAAHNHAPIGAVGLSVGVQDAVNLGWKMAATIAGWAPDGLLDTYHAERHAVGEQLLRDVHAQNLLYLGGDEMEPLRSVTRELVTVPAAAEYLAGLVSGVSIRYDMGAGGHPLLGLRMPDRELEPADGGKLRMYELMRRARGVLVVPDTSAEALRVAAAWSDRVDQVSGTWLPAEPTGRPAPDAVLVRPDGYVAWVAPDGGDLRAALSRWFGAPAS